ncbi:MAG: glycosyltransferase family 2 protein [Chitinophagales bacterium]
MNNLADIGIQTNKRSRITNPVFSILIPSWNNLSYLKLCIESIQRNSRFQHQIIIHINEGRDGTLDWIGSQESIDFTHSRENIGVCYALNLSSTLADSDYLLFMNDDMYACPDWDLELHNEMRSIGHPYFFLSSTAIEPFDTNNPCALIMDCGRDIENFDEGKLLKVFMSQRMNDWQGATWPPNLIHKQIWRLVGGYSTEFSPGMYSDPDFSMKLWNLGIRFFKGCSKSRVYHFGSKSVGRVKRNKGYFRFIEKWGLTSDTFTRHYLKRGQPFSGPLPEPHLSIGIRFKNFIKRAQTAFRQL